MASRYEHGHTYDLFVSYSTRDLDWVRQFHDELVADVNRFASPDIDPFLDKKRLEPGCLWDEKLLTAASDSAILVPVLSPRFFDSDYCQKEVQAFIDTRGLTSGIAHRSGIMPVKLLSGAPSDHVLAREQAVTFCAESDGYPVEYLPGTQEYKDALRKLAYAIAQVLKAMPPKQQRRAAVYLAPDFRALVRATEGIAGASFRRLAREPDGAPRTVACGVPTVARARLRALLRERPSVERCPIRQGLDRCADRVRQGAE